MRPGSSSLYLATCFAAALIASTSGGSALSFAVGSRGGLRSGFASAGPPPIGGQQTGIDLRRRSGRQDMRDGRDRFGEGGCGFGGRNRRGGRSYGSNSFGSFGGGCGDLGGFGGYGGYGAFSGAGDPSSRVLGLPSASGIRPSPVLPPAIYVIEPAGRRGARSGEAAPAATGPVTSLAPGQQREVLASGAMVTRISP